MAILQKPCFQFLLRKRIKYVPNKILFHVFSNGLRAGFLLFGDLGRSVDRASALNMVSSGPMFTWLSKKTVTDAAFYLLFKLTAFDAQNNLYIFHL